MICSNPKILFNSVKYVDLSAPILEVILKQDDLNSYEIEIWKYLIKWGLAKDKILNEDVSKWIKKNLIFLKEFFINSYR